MSRVLTIALLLLFATRTAAQEPAATVDRLADLTLAGCKYLSAKLFETRGPRPQSRTLASHFGKVVKASKRGCCKEFFLESPLFAGWRMAYFERGLTLTLPPNIYVTVADLERRLGQAQYANIDYAVRAPVGNDATTDKPIPEEFEFRHIPGSPRACFVSVQTDGKDPKWKLQRVLSFGFQD